MYLFHSLPALFFFTFSFSYSALALTATASAGNPQSTACGDIVNDPRSNDPDQTPVFKASVIYECLTSVPFDAGVATSFIQYYNDTIQFQSTLEYLKNPPTSYQQPAVDLVGSLAQLQSKVIQNSFQNQYEFEAALQTLLFAAHDSHLVLESGILAAFSFGSPVDLVSVSADGIQVPKVFIAADIAYNDGQYTPSAITTINGEDVTTYLENFAAMNNLGGLESHTDWNQLFFSAAEGVQGLPNIFTGDATFYPGDTITFDFENKTSQTYDFMGVYYSQGPTGPLETGGDFFNFFVLGFYPQSYDPALVDNNNLNITAPSSSASISQTTASLYSSSAASPTSTSSSTAASCVGLGSDFYPTCADIAQKDQDVEQDGAGVTGYLLKNNSIAVLSLPNFYAPTNFSLATFDAAVADFITKSQAAGMTKIVIDLQSNEGGEPLLAIDTFKHFFPNIDPFGGSRLRATSAANVLGQTLTSVFQNLNHTDDEYEQLVDSEWVATTRLNANTNQTFASWPEFFGPSESNDDFFTTTQRYDLDNTDFVEASIGDFDATFTVYGYGAEKAAPAAPPFKAENIVMLSDGICASACALFMEMMHHEADVKVVAVGGRPTTGPMQAPAGTRGAISYNTLNLDGDISTVQTVLQQNNSPDSNFLPDRSDTGDVFVTFASVNLRDQVRRGETTPLQFAYEAADCRIFYTPQTIFNYTRLWQYAADAIWTTPSLCVTNSTGFVTASNSSNFLTGPNGTDSNPRPTSGQIAPNLSINGSSLLDLDLDTTIYDDFVSSALADPPTLCNTDADCTALETSESCISNENCSRRRCVQFDPCGTVTKGGKQGQCLTGCKTLGLLCGFNGATCTNKLPIFKTTTATIDQSQNICPWVESCNTGNNGKVKRLFGTSQTPTQSRSTSGKAQTPGRR